MAALDQYLETEKYEALLEIGRIMSLATKRRVGLG